MADIYYTGKALPVAQVSRVQVGANDAATTYSLTVNGVSVSVTGAASVEATTAALVAAWNASTHPYFSPITAAVDSGVSPSNDITLTADEAGFPFTVTASVSGGSGSIGSVTQDATATGPNHWSNADNWSLARLPDNGDRVFVAVPGTRLCWDLDRSGESPTELWSRLRVVGDVRIGLSFSGVATSADGDTVSSAAPEYRDQYLKAAITTVDVLPDPSVSVVTGSARLHVHNTDTVGSIATVRATAQTAADTARPAICLLCDSANADLYVSSARAGVGVAKGNPGETATIGEVTVDDPTNGSRLFLGEGVTHSTFVQNGGVSEIDSAATMPSITVNGGTCTVAGDQAVTALIANGGTVIANTTGTIATLTQEEGSLLDFWRSARARTVTTYNYNGGARKIDDYLTITNDNRSGRITETIS